MLMLTKYWFRSDPTPDQMRALLSKVAEMSAEAPDSSGVVGQWVAADTRFGINITDVDSASQLHQSMQQLQEWLHIEITPLVTIDESMASSQQLYFND